MKRKNKQTINYNILKNVAFVLFFFFTLFSFSNKVFAYTVVEVTENLTFSSPNSVDFFFSTSTPTTSEFNDAYNNGSAATLIDFKQQLTDQTTISCSYGGYSEDGYWVAGKIIGGWYEEYNYWECISGAIVSSSTLTKIISITPYNDQLFVSTTSSTTIGLTGYLAQTDLNNGSEATFFIENSNNKFRQITNVIGSRIDDNGYSENLVIDLNDWGSFSYSTSTTSLPEGTYYITAKIKKGDWCLLSYCLGSETITATSTQFIVGTTTKADMIVKNSNDFYDGLATHATSTTALKENCNVILNFDFYECMSNLMIVAFVPDSRAFDYNLNLLKTGVATHFPFGYAYDFVDILSTTTVGTLTVIDATLPNALGVGTGHHLYLNLTGVLDPYLNATTSIFNNESASSTETLYEITVVYWKIILYILAVFYIMARILGSQIIPSIKQKK